MASQASRHGITTSSAWVRAMVGLWHAAAATALGWWLATRGDGLRAMSEASRHPHLTLAHVGDAVAPLAAWGVGLVALLTVAYLGGGILAWRLTTWERGRLAWARDQADVVAAPAWAAALGAAAVAVAVVLAALATLTPAITAPLSPGAGWIWLALAATVWVGALVRAAVATVGLLARLSLHHQRVTHVVRDQRRRHAARRAGEATARRHDRVIHVALNTDGAMVHTEHGVQHVPPGELDAVLALARRDQATVTRETAPGKYVSNSR